MSPMLRYSFPALGVAGVLPAFAQQSRTNNCSATLRVFVSLCARAIARLRSGELAYLGVQAGMRHACDDRAERTKVPNDSNATA